jgi:hypothetical protein
MSRGDLLGVGGAEKLYALASSVNDVVAAAREDEDEGQLGATNQSSNLHRRRVVETLSDHCDERTLKTLSEIVREALGRRGTAGTGESNPSFGRKFRAARRRIELEGVGIAEGGTVADTRLHAVGTTTGESKGSDGDEVTRDGILARNHEFVQHQRKEKERVDAMATQEEKPDTQYDNPTMQQQQQRQQRMAAADDSYGVFGTGAERTVPPGDGKDTQYGNPMMQQQQQPARQEAEEAETTEEELGRGGNNLIREQTTRTYTAATGRGQGGGARGGEAQPLYIDAVARSSTSKSTSIVTE